MFENQSRADFIRASFIEQSGWCAKLGCPFMSLLCEGFASAIDRTTLTGNRVLDWRGDPNADALTVRLSGGIHAMVRAGKLPSLASLFPPAPTPKISELVNNLKKSIHERDTELLSWLDEVPQTNEVARSGVLMPGMMFIASKTNMPLELFEIGSSAGLNLLLDFYSYRFGDLCVGPQNAPIRICPIWTGELPPKAEVKVVSRRGADLQPLDAADHLTRERLLSYVWPGQPDRIELLQRALEFASTNKPPIDKENGADWVERLIKPKEGVATVLFHSIAMQYFTEVDNRRVVNHMEKMGRHATQAAPLAWLSYEFEPGTGSAVLDLRIWPDGLSTRLAFAHPHGASIRWLH